ncbi:cryptochrome-2 [Episyrphus balteatus]|uniref:cryptochrome-2 n=1 Tax=Episyrphus balteatus TaxID=286459 RepID=UPI002485F7ED|nr:cryptochrome-2 [Episyrphus balteatus]
MESNHTVIHWFRKGLRIHDNPALVKACELINQNSNYKLRPVFILDPAIRKWMRVGANRMRFLQESLLQLNENLQRINSRLYVVRGIPDQVFPKLLKSWNVKVLTFETDIEPYARKRDASVVKLCNEHNVEVAQFSSHTIYNPEIVLRRNMGKPPLTYQKFLSLVEKLPVPEPASEPGKLPKSNQPSADEEETLNPKCYDPPSIAEVIERVQELGINKFPGGETEGLRRLDESLKNSSWVCSFEKPNTSPNSLEPSTTVLSPYLKFGCLSSLLFYKRLKKILEKNSKHSKPPVSLMGQLMWREFYYTAGAAEPNFDRMIGNSICLQIPWEKNDEHLEAWAHGRTGYPFIDAIMRQLRQEGWIHHLARHAVACFLTRGDLWISWEEGQKVFEELLLDADWALNAGNWMWLSASAFFHQFFRVYSPVAFGKKTDPQGNYIKKYVPELKKYPSGIIYEPWKASTIAQMQYGCVIGKDYPKRIVIHETIHKENLKKMSEAYKVNKDVKGNAKPEPEGGKRAAKSSKPPAKRAKH